MMEIYAAVSRPFRTPPCGTAIGVSMATVNPADALDAAFRGLHSRLRREAVLTGVGWCLATGLALFVAVGLIDWYWHIDNPRGRQGLVAAAGLVWGLLLFRLVIAPACVRRRATETALEIEAQRPHWRGALASSVEFATARCRPGDGSPALQQSLIARTQSRLSEHDLQSVFHPGRRRMAAGAALLTGLLTAAVIAADPGSAGLALARLATPMSAPSWPREHTLVLLDAAFEVLDAQQPARPAALGERLLVYVDDTAANLPEQVTMHIETPDGVRVSQPVERTTISDRSGVQRVIGVAVLPAGSRQIQVRATGGDDQRMPWHTFEFVPRPSVRRFRLELTPPAYTGQAPQQIESTSGNLRALVGTQVRLSAELDAPVREAAFQQSGLPTKSVRLSADGRTFSAEFPISSAAGGVFAIELLSRDGLRNSDPPGYRVEGIVDREPTVALTRPLADVTVTPEAVIPVRIEAGDDLGLAYVRLSIAQPPDSAGEQLRPQLLEQPLAREAAIDTEVSPAEFGLPPGRVLVLSAEAADAYDLDGRHVVRSLPRTLRIVTPEEKLRELGVRQAGIAELLQRSSDQQLRAIEQTRALQLQWQAARRLSAADGDALRRLAHDLEQATSTLYDAERGAVREARRMLEELAWNRLDDPETVGRLTQLDGELRRLQAELVPVMEQAVATAVQEAAEGDEGALPSARGALAEVERAEVAIHDLVSGLSLQFAAWRQQHDLTRSLNEIVLEQSQLNRETREIGRRTLTTPLADLPAEDRAALEHLGRRQEHAADRLEAFETQLEALNSHRDAEADDAGGVPAANMERALEIASQGAVGELMRRAAQQIAVNSMAESAETQARIASALEQLAQAVRGLGEPPPEILVRQVERAAAEAEALQQRQLQLRDTARQLADRPDRAETATALRGQQQSLADETAQWAQRLRRQLLAEAAAGGDEAAARMRDAIGRMSADDWLAAQAEQESAAASLQQTRNTLDAARRQIESDQTASAWSRLTSLLETFVERQSQLLAEVVRLDAEQRRRGSLSRSQLRTLLATAAAQSQLGDDVERVRDDPAGVAIIREALGPAIEQMRRAAGRLGERQIDDATRSAQESALQQLQSLRSDLQIGPASPADESEAVEISEGSLPAANWPVAAQLKVLLRLQSEIGERAAALRNSTGAESLSADEQVRRRLELADRQSRIAELLEQLMLRHEAPEIRP